MKEQQIRDAATLVALRDSPNGPELLMMERTGKAVFAGGCWVFPGGATEESDWDSAWKTHCDPPQGCHAESGICAKEQRALRICAIREAIEEASIACTDPVPADSDIHALRDHLNSGEVQFIDWCERQQVRLPLDRLVLWSQWVTPKGEPRRFNARFYFADFSQIDTRARADGVEALATRWIRPADAIHEAERNRFRLMPPTIRQLMEIRDFDSVASLLDWAATQQAVQPILSRFRIRNGRFAGISLPGDADYEDCVDEIPRELLQRA